jgi:hypothetical protein
MSDAGTHQDLWRIEFDLEPNEVHTFVRYTMLGSARGRRFMLVERLGLAALVVISGLARGILSGDWKLAAFYAIINLVGGVPAAWVAPWALRSVAAWVSSNRQSAPGGAVGRWVYSVTAAGIAYSHNAEQGLIAWDGIDGVDVTHDAVYVFVNPVRAGILPTRVLGEMNEAALLEWFAWAGVRVRSAADGRSQMSTQTRLECRTATGGAPHNRDTSSQETLSGPSSDTVNSP